MSAIEVRPARAEDKDTVLAFCAHTWEWGDYIEHVWDEWLHDPTGQLLVAVIDERPVGVTHIRMLNATDAWLEGMRVDPDYRNQGIAKALNTASLEEAMRRGATNARLATESTNDASIHIMESIHMRQVGSFAPFTAQPIATEGKRQPSSDSTQLATLDDLDEIIDYMNASNTFPAVGGLYYVGFTAYEITAQLLKEHIAAQHIYLLRRWDRIDGLAIAEPRNDRQGKRLSIGYIDGMTIEAISLVAYDLRRRLSTLGLESIYAYAPDLMLVRDGLAGIEYEWNGSVFYTYERSLV